MKNKFKIINSENEIGVVEKIWVNDYKVEFHPETIRAEIQHYDFIGVENLINSGSWKVLSDYNNFDVLPKEFKFVLSGDNDGCIFTYRENNYGRNNVFWQDSYEEESAFYEIWSVQEMLTGRNWLMLEDGFVPQHNSEESVTCYQAYAEVNHEGDDLLQTLKQFVEEFDAQVEVCKKGYRIYSDNETLDAYHANSDEELKEILQAIRVLKKYEGV